MSAWGFIAVGIGGVVGCWTRWLLALTFNFLFPSIPPGTVIANFVGAYVIGAAIAFFSSASHLAPEWRLLITTGFCGGLTTFSTFSAEITVLLQSERWATAAGAVALHVGGSIILTFAGIASMQWFTTR